MTIKSSRNNKGNERDMLDLTSSYWCIHADITTPNNLHLGEYRAHWWYTRCSSTHRLVERTTGTGCCIKITWLEWRVDHCFIGVAVLVSRSQWWYKAIFKQWHRNKGKSLASSWLVLLIYSSFYRPCTLSQVDIRYVHIQRSKASCDKGKISIEI